MNFRSPVSGFPTRRERPIYLDHHATTPVDRRVAARMFEVLTENFGNPNDRGHAYGDQAAEIIEEARLQVASLVSGYPEAVTFLRSATVAVNALLAKLIERRSGRGPLRVAATTVEHHALLDCLDRWQATGEIAVDLIGVDSAARLNADSIIKALERGCDLLCVMAANNEVGTIYPVEQIAALTKSAGAALLVDGSQAAASVRLNVEDWPISYLVVSAHKMYGPKGVAALICNSDIADITKGLESGEGTPNVPAIAGLGEACRICACEMAADNARIAALRDHFQRLLQSKIPDLRVNGDPCSRLPHNLHISIPGVPNDAVVARLFQSVAVSTGSACRSGTDEPSHVLRAMELEPWAVEGALRIGLGRSTSSDDVERAAELIAAAVIDIRALQAVEQ